MYKLKILDSCGYCANNDYFQGVGSEATFALICFKFLNLKTIQLILTT